MKITLHTDKCISCGLCTSIAPDIFSLDTGTVSLNKDPKTFTEEDKKLAREASAACPNGVIEITEE
jgi:ferredoxin